MTYDVGTLSAARLWPYHPDWSSGYSLTRAFLTDISASRNNTEQRRALRDVPRLSASYSAVVADNDLQAAKHYLRAWQNKPAAVPDFSRYAPTTALANAGAGSITVASPPAWVAVGQLAVLCGGGEMELIEIDGVAGSAISIAGVLANSWPSGSTLRPVLFGLLDARLRGARLTRGAQRLSVAISAYPGGEPPEDEGAAAASFNGYEVFTAEPDFSGQPSIEYLWPVEQVDYGRGRTAQFRPIDRAESLTEAQFGALAPGDAQEIEQFFLRHKGSRNAFYRPTCEKDMTLAANVSTSVQINVAGTALATDFGAVDYGDNPTAIEIVQTNGTRVRRLITAIAINGANSRITVNSAVTLTVAGTARMSWMPLVRFSSDELTTQWRSPASASIRAGFQTVKR